MTSKAVAATSYVDMSFRFSPIILEYNERTFAAKVNATKQPVTVTLNTLEEADVIFLGEARAKVHTVILANAGVSCTHQRTSLEIPPQLHRLVCSPYSAVALSLPELLKEFERVDVCFFSNGSGRQGRWLTQKDEMK